VVHGFKKIRPRAVGSQNAIAQDDWTTWDFEFSLHDRFCPGWQDSFIVTLPALPLLHFFEMICEVKPVRAIACRQGLRSQKLIPSTGKHINRCAQVDGEFWLANNSSAHQSPSLIGPDCHVIEQHPSDSRTLKNRLNFLPT
jgi:hypothetical protein